MDIKAINGNNLNEVLFSPSCCYEKIRGFKHSFISDCDNVDGIDGRAVAQAVSRWRPTAAARVRVRAACGVFGGQSGIGAAFLRVHRFPCQSSFHQFLQHDNHPGLAQ
jgi:hypothetical protein